MADETELRTNAVIQDRNGVTGTLLTRINPQGEPEPYWVVQHGNSGRQTTVLERRLLTSDYRVMQ